MDKKTAPPTIKYLDFNNLKTWELLSNRKFDIIIVDNFSPDCNSIRNEAIKNKYNTKFTESGYEYNFTHPTIQTTETSLNLIYRILGNDTNDFLLSYFVYETIENEKSTKLTNWIHCDPWKWVGLHYLNLPEQCRGGTSFYKHIPTNNFSFNYGIDSNILEIKNDGINKEKWLLFFEVELKWNRLILFRPSFFHSPSCYFGTNITDARIYQLFTFN